MSFHDRVACVVMPAGLPIGVVAITYRPRFTFSAVLPLPKRS